MFGFLENPGRMWFGVAACQTEGCTFCVCARGACSPLSAPELRCFDENNIIIFTSTCTERKQSGQPTAGLCHPTPADARDSDGTHHKASKQYNHAPKPLVPPFSVANACGVRHHCCPVRWGGVRIGLNARRPCPPCPTCTLE